jgi:hypothetical protein
MPPAAFSPLGRAHILLRTLRSPKRLRPSLRHDSGQDWTPLFEHSLMVSHVGFCHSYAAKNPNISNIQQSLRGKGRFLLNRPW